MHDVVYLHNPELAIRILWKGFVSCGTLLIKNDIGILGLKEGWRKTEIFHCERPSRADPKSAFNVVSTVSFSDG